MLNTNNHKQDLDFVSRWAKRLTSISLKGGKCKFCGEKRVYALDFHHKDGNKVVNINTIKNSRLSVIKKELKKCILLCRNCHAEIHYGSGRGSKRKLEILGEMGISKCSKCGYSGKNFASLDFHHKTPKNKRFAIGEWIHGKQRKLSDKDVFSEIQKCDVICRNCHAKEHFNIGRFTKLNRYIKEKVKKFQGRNYKEQCYVNENNVINLRRKHVPVNSIAEKENCHISSIWRILKKYNMDNSCDGHSFKMTSKFDHDKIISLRQKGVAVKNISIKTGFSKNTIYRILRKNKIKKPEIKIDHDKFLKLRNLGKNIREIAKIFHCGEPKIINYMIKNKINSTLSPCLTILEDRIISMGNKGLSNNFIAIKLGFSKKSIDAILYYNKIMKLMSKKDVSLIIKFRKKGIKIKKISERLEMSVRIIRFILRRKNMPIDCLRILS